MFKKLVVLNISCQRSPCQLIIGDCSDKIIHKNYIKPTSSKICFCTNDCVIKVFAKYQNVIYYKILHLSNCKFQIFFIDFAFNTLVLQKVINRFMLSDAMYGLPVKEANLTFQSVVQYNYQLHKKAKKHTYSAKYAFKLHIVYALFFSPSVHLRDDHSQEILYLQFLYLYAYLQLKKLHHTHLRFL